MSIFKQALGTVKGAAVTAGTGAIGGIASGLAGNLLGSLSGPKKSAEEKAKEREEFTGNLQQIADKWNELRLVANSVGVPMPTLDKVIVRPAGAVMTPTEINSNLNKVKDAYFQYLDQTREKKGMGFNIPNLSMPTRMQPLADGQQLDDRNININDVLNGAIGGAVNGVGGVIAGTNQAGNVGASIVDSTIRQWLARHWWKIAILPFAILIYLLVRKSKNRR